MWTTTTNDEHRADGSILPILSHMTMQPIHRHKFKSKISGCHVRFPQCVCDINGDCVCVCASLCVRFMSLQFFKINHRTLNSEHTFGISYTSYKNGRTMILKALSKLYFERSPDVLTFPNGNCKNCMTLYFRYPLLWVCERGKLVCLCVCVVYEHSTNMVSFVHRCVQQ